MAMYSETGFVMIPENNDALWSKDPRFSLNHAYILERVRSFSNHNLPCFISNSRFARELHASESTVTRAIKLLVEKNVLWASYNQESETNKQRVLWVYDEQKATRGDKKSQKQDNSPASKSPKFGLSVSQNEDTLSSVCLPARFKMTASDSQNGALVHKNTSKTDKLVDKNIIGNTFYVENKAQIALMIRIILPKKKNGITIQSVGLPLQQMHLTGTRKRNWRICTMKHPLIWRTIFR